MSEAFRRKRPTDAAQARRRGRQVQIGDPPPGQMADPIDVSRYAAEICAELCGMASSAKLGMLSYLLGMARQEAERIARTESVAD